ncbi:TIGR03084 family protein [Nocardioides sp. zg-579]|uniref:TIGR03084 family protein n=1 Tax=Nocardioides marmotae TaxID=2663857 RepID=A0A6I3JFD1_9ACTN|nr:TIGR03084 family metal-binding protein [Nocardioides marmotae]MCR6033016.1 TIGR03084 family protein [Gordonia jinghuaiqii]MTB96668.1 TIGR03084 family protein [Nocardioides marmotae]QKE03115.1 TIGR03084 family protein [Nocardioides marmotae]
MTLLEDLLADLRAEGDQLAAVVSGLDADGWARPTPAPGWSVATQVAHLVWTDEVALLSALSAAGDETATVAWTALVGQAAADPEGFVDAGAHEIARLAPQALLTRWGAARVALARVLRDLPAGVKMPWFGPPMSAASMATARYMETWAHSLDVHEALGLEPTVTDRVRHVAHLGVRTRDFSFATRGLTPPTEEFRVELAAPGDATWAWGPEGAAQSVTGSAADFCRLVTQRVHRTDTDLVAVGADADRWLDVAQCFAGPPGEGRRPRG